MIEEINIPHIGHRVYDKSFLEGVVVKINHSAKFDASNKNIIVDLIKNNYSLHISDEDINLLGYKTLRLKDTNIGLHIKIGDSFIQIMLENKSYISFIDSMLVHVSSFVHSIYKMNGIIEKISIEKINTWTIENSRAADKNNITKFAERIFGKSVVAKLKDHYSKDNVKAELTVNRQEDSSIYILSAGWIKFEKLTLFLLNNEGICSDPELLRENSILKTIVNLNQSLFDIFHWGVSDFVINLMMNKQ